MRVLIDCFFYKFYIDDSELTKYVLPDGRRLLHSQTLPAAINMNPCAWWETWRTFS